MSQVLQTVYASAPSNQIPLHTITLEAPSFPDGALRWVQGGEDVSMGLENNGGTVLYEAVPIAISLPDVGARGNQDIQFQMDNVTGEAYHYVRQAIKAGEKIKCTYRVYLDSDKFAPAETPIKMTATTVSADYKTVQVVADFHDFLNKKWPDLRYTADFAPGLKYI